MCTSFAVYFDQPIYGMNFDKIWKVSLVENLIESYQGFNEYPRFELGKSGIKTSKLLKL